MAKDPLIAPPGKRVHLKKWNPESTKHVPEREAAEKQTQEAADRIGQMQDLLYADGRRSLLVVLQGMDASGKDGTVRRVFDAVNPTGITVSSFKSPTPLEQRHDFLWRCHALVPPRGNLGVFNRSYYEEVLIVRVHADRLLPPELHGVKDVWEARYRLINGFEQLLELNGTRVLKFFLHISKDEQRKRFRDRQKDPKANWKLAGGDFTERAFWADYQHAYEEALQYTSTEQNPWFIIPSDRKWVRNFHISRIIAQAMEEMNLKWPKAADKSLLTRKFE